MTKYAKGTSVSVENSRAEIERTLYRYGVKSKSFVDTSGKSAVTFQASGLFVRFTIELPEERDFALTPTKKMRADTERRRAWEQACREKWRALALAIKAKLEIVDSNISSFEREFLAHIVAPDGTTIGDHIVPRIADAFAKKDIGPLLGFTK